jgi:hypothetical protein
MIKYILRTRVDGFNVTESDIESDGSMPRISYLRLPNELYEDIEPSMKSDADAKSVIVAALTMGIYAPEYIDSEEIETLASIRAGLLDCGEYVDEAEMPEYTDGYACTDESFEYTLIPESEFEVVRVADIALLTEYREPIDQAISKLTDF